MPYHLCDVSKMAKIDLILDKPLLSPCQFSSKMPPGKRCQWRQESLILLLILSTRCLGKKPGGGFGGDFSAASMSGADTPGPTSGSMGGKAASAMAIGTGDSGPGNYASNFKTPNYTQYTNQNFKDFLPNYESMMEKSMSGGGGGSKDGGGSSYSNFSSVNSLLKGFMELQKEQLKLDKVKAETAKAKVDLAMDYDEGDYVAPGKADKRRRKRSMMIQMEDLGMAKDKLLALLLNNTSVNELKNLVSQKYGALLQDLKKPKHDELSAQSPIKSHSDMKWGSVIKPVEKYEPPIKVKIIGPRPFKWKSKLDVPTVSSTKYVRQWGGGKYFKRDQPPPPPADPNSPPPSSFWANLGTKASTWFKNSPGGTPPGGSDPAANGAWSSKTPGTSGGSPASSWDSSGLGTGSSSPSWGGSPGVMGGGGSSSWTGQGGSPPPSGGGAQGVGGGSNGSNGQQDQTGSSQPMRGMADSGANGGWSSMSPPPSTGGAYPSGPPSSQGSQQRRGIMPSYPMHGSVALSDEPPLMASGGSKPMMMGFNNDNAKNIPDLSFSLSSLFPSKSMKGPERVKPPSRPPAMQVVESPLYQSTPLVKYSTELRPIWILPGHPKPPLASRPSPIYPTANGMVLSPSYSEYPSSERMDDMPTGYERSPMREMRKTWPIESATTSPKPMIISKEDNKVLIDPINGVIIVKDSKVPVKLRSKREVSTTEASPSSTTSTPVIPSSMTTSEVPSDPNGHSHGTKNDMGISSAGSYPWKLYLRDLYQAQMDGQSKDYDTDHTQVEDEKNLTPSIDNFTQEPGQPLVNSLDGNRRRRVKLAYSQKAHLPPGSTESISVGGGRAPGHHEGGGLTVKIKIPPKMHGTVSYE
ncbi:uncharacterized protein LOC131893474 isoform X2 [Tigriopus californicus]|uniref:uncharacterized protein LOC131893474 isoform X2 n=1 Tax=Tigriopus californicus TaxID=6832 RepID=UPI0027DA10DF|nr:uncharacterized protein LOC131893474 isoform X2 [Tigriopus californicus]